MPDDIYDPEGSDGTPDWSTRLGKLLFSFCALAIVIAIVWWLL